MLGEQAELLADRLSYLQKMITCYDRGMMQKAVLWAILLTTDYKIYAIMKIDTQDVPTKGNRDTSTLHLLAG